MSLLKRLLSPEYWVVAQPGRPGPFGLGVHAALGIVFLAVVVLAIRMLWCLSRQQRAGQEPAPSPVQSWLWWCELALSLAGLTTTAGRLLGWAGWSARIWPPTLAASALLGVVAYQLRDRLLPHWLVAQLRVLALLPPLRSRAPTCLDAASADHAGGHRRAWIRGLAWGSVLCLHLAGIALVLTVRLGLSPWLAPPLLIVLLIPQLRHLVGATWPSLLGLTPLLAGYVATLLWSTYEHLGTTVVGWQGLAFPDPVTSLFYVDGILLASVSHCWLCQLQLPQWTPVRWETNPERVLAMRTGVAWRWAAACLLVIATVWAGVVYLGKRTHGATGSDPYAYAQMAMDLADHGTFLHRFALFPEVLPLGIAWGPLLPSGYHLPINEEGDAASVWATGASVLLAGGTRIVGEEGLYVTTPVIALLALVATWFLVMEVLRDEAGSVRNLAAALTVALTAASPEFVDRTLVPMADAAALLFTVLALLFGLRAIRFLDASPRRAVAPLILAGLSFAWAYWVRHTQLVLFLPLAGGLWAAGGRGSRSGSVPNTPESRRRAGLNRLWPILVLSVSALIMAIPDTIYRWRVFGGIFATETSELPSMSLRHIGPMALQTLRDSLVAGEWGYLFPFAVVGCCSLARRNRRPFTVLLGAFFAVLFVHLPYRFLRLRDLISLFPLVNLAVAYGALDLIRRARTWALGAHRPERVGPALLGTLVLGWAILGLALARWTMIDDAWRPGWASFGYMNPDQRAAFDRLAEITPPDAVIGASLNSGAVMMYTGREAVRPYESWTAQDWDTFVTRMEAASRRVYLLDDGNLMSTFIATLDPRYRLLPAEELVIPLFGAPGRNTGWLYELETQE